MKKLLHAMTLLFSLFCFLPEGHCEGRVPQYDVESTGRFFREWLVCGPFPNAPGYEGREYEHDSRCTGFFKDLLGAAGGEQAADPVEGQTFVYPENGKSYEWQWIRSDDDRIILANLLKPKDRVVAYAYCHLIADQPCHRILSIGSNDGIRVFLNGLLVHDHHVSRWLSHDSDYVPIRLEKGVNRVLLKIDQGKGDWGFSARLLEKEVTLESIRKNLTRHSRLTVVTREDKLVAQFGEPFKIVNLNPGKKVRIEVRDASGELQALLHGPPGFEIEFPIFSFSEGPLHFEASFRLADGGEVRSRRGHRVGKLPRHSRVRNLSEDLASLRDGNPFFPIGTYGAGEEDYPLLKQLGYNFVVAPVDSLDRVHEAGLLAAVPFHGDSEEYLKHLEETLRQYKDHPAVLCWMLADEPGYNRMDLLNIHRAYRLAYEIDPVHPTYLVLTFPTAYDTFGRCCDVLAVDTYPISKNPPSHVGMNVARAYDRSDGDLPVWACNQMFDWPADRLPTPTEHRFMTYHSLLEGAKGILWFTYRWQGKRIREKDPVLWKSHEQLLKELRYLEPFLVTQGRGIRLQPQSSAGTIRAAIRMGPGDSKMVIALNLSEELETEAEIELPAGTNVSEWTVLNEDRSISLSEGRWKDRFGPLEVHVYVSE